MAVVWPQAAFASPVLRGLDDNARGAIADAGKVRNLGPGVIVFDEGDLADTFLVVAQGTVDLSSVPRGHEIRRQLRVVHTGDTLGEEACLEGSRRRARAATGPQGATVCEVPVNVYRRVAGRIGAQGLLEEQERRLRRQATHDLLRTMAFTRDLPEADLGVVLDAAQHANYERGNRIYGPGEIADAFYLVAEGLVQLQTEDDEVVRVQAYVSSGDFFGDEELLRGTRRELGAVAMGACALVRVPSEAFHEVARRNPAMLGRIRRVATEQREEQADLISEAAARSTKHVFQDLYRMQMASSLLAIDQDHCVRCGHCAWSCAQTHGVARLVRRGDKIVTQLEVIGSDPHNLMLPNSCQHCKNPVCMIDCPTGAIGRDARGEVFIREELCTGCGGCAKACPWENIRMAPRPEQSKLADSLLDSPTRAGRSLEEMFPEVAVKCDQCRSYEAPACVQSCPTGAIVRLDPSRDFVEVAAFLGNKPGKGGRVAKRGPFATFFVAGAATTALTAGIFALGQQASGAWISGEGTGLLAGIMAALMFGLLAAYALPKRAIRILWMRTKAAPSQRQGPMTGFADSKAEKPTQKAARSRVRPFYLLHVALGLLTMAAVLAHAGSQLPPGVAGALQMCFWFTAVLGAFGAGAYRILPGRLSRLESRGSLPEDLESERRELDDRLQRGLSNRGPVLQKIAQELLLPYAGSIVGPLALAVSGDSLREEQERLLARARQMAHGQPASELHGLDDLVTAVVERRALPARRVMTFALRAWLPIHAAATGALLLLVVLHVLTVSFR